MKKHTKELKKYPDPKRCHPNVSFSVQQLSDTKYATKYRIQRRTRGFDDTELWNLDRTIIKFIVPRLEEFIKQTSVFNTEYGSLDNWKKYLLNILGGFKAYLNNENAEEQTQFSFENFSKVLPYLWY